MRILDDGGAECCGAVTYPSEPADHLWSDARDCGCVIHRCEGCGSQETNYCPRCLEMVRQDEVESQEREKDL